MTTMTIDPDAIQADAEKRLAELKEQAGRLAPEALADERIAQELRDVESEREAAERQLEHVRLARSEIDRREQTAKAEAEQARKTKLIAQADKLAARLAAAGEQIDSAALRLGEAVAAHLDIAQREHALRVEAGISTPTHTMARPYDSAVRHAFGVAGVGAALEPTLGGGPLGPRPMIEQPTTKRS